MKSFTDKQKRDWHINITIGMVKTVRDRTNVDILEMFNSEVANRLMNDLPTLVNVMFVLCEKECVERHMTDVDFGEMFDGDLLESATQALMNAVTDFFPQSRRQIMTAAITKANEIRQRNQTAALEAIAKM